MSMVFRELKLLNWIPYCGDQTLRFNEDNQFVNMTLIRGQNKGGKSAIIRAIKWVLYGDTGDISEYQRPLEILNRDAKNNGEYKFMVGFILDHDGKRIQITRTMEPNEGISVPKDKDFQTTLTIQENKKWISGDSVDQYIKEMLPQNISDFFLFDGELLQQYKGLTAETASAKKLKNQIEKVIKTPYIRGALEDLRAIKRGYLKKVMDRTDDKQLELLLSKIRELSLKEDEFSRDLKELEENIETEREKVKRINSDLANFDEMAETMNDLSLARSKATFVENELATIKETIRSQTSSAWFNLASTFIKSKRCELQRELEDLTKFIDENRINSALSSLYERTHRQCELCGSDLTEKEHAYIRDKINKVSLKDTGPAENKLKEVQKLLNRISSTDNFVLLREQPDKFLDYSEQLSEHYIEIENLEKKCNQSEERDIKNLIKEQTACNHEIKALEDSIDRIQKELEGPAERAGDLYTQDGLLESKKQCENLLEKLQKDKPVFDRNQKLLEICNQAEKTLDATLEKLIFRVKGEIEEFANEIYQSITVEKSQTRLKINDGFGLDVLDANGEAITTSSAGNQIVALSLLCGLKKATGLRGPLLIDTPFARVDLEHRQSMLNSYADMTDQIILLVHSGEIDENSELEQSIAKNVGARYLIKKESDTSSYLERL